MVVVNEEDRVVDGAEVTQEGDREDGRQTAVASLGGEVGAMRSVVVVEEAGAVAKDR